MYKISLLLLFSFSLLFAEAIHFKETRYIYALNHTLLKHGVIGSSRDGLAITYDKSGKKLLYKKDILVIVNKGKKKVIDLNKDIVTRLFFVVLQAVFNDDRGQLKQFFTIKSKGSQHTLLPKELASQRIVKIIYQKNDRLDYLHIYLKNQDRISIEQVD